MSRTMSLNETRRVLAEEHAMMQSDWQHAKLHTCLDGDCARHDFREASELAHKVAHAEGQGMQDGDRYAQVEAVAPARTAPS